jgi:hypothetical protein
MPKTRHNTTLGDLKERIAELESQYGEDVLELPVYSSSDYGDHCHTQQITRLNEVQVHIPEETAYSKSGMAVTDETEVSPIGIGSCDVAELAVVLMGW